MIDYKNTPEGKEVSRKYADILPLSRPEPSHVHPRMSKLNRARFSSHSPRCEDMRKKSLQKTRNI